MNQHGSSLPSNEFTAGVIQAFFDVYNELGYGLSEKFYTSAMEILLSERGFSVRREVPIKVHFHGRYLGFYRADLIVNDCLVVENKAGPALPPGSQEQLINYLRQSPPQLGLLFHLGPSPQFKRVINSAK